MVVYYITIVCLWLQRNSPVTKKYQVPFGFVGKVFNCILMTGCVMRCSVVAAMFMTRKEGSDSVIVLMIIEPITKMVEMLTLPEPGECVTNEQINQRTDTTPRVAMTSTLKLLSN